MFSSNQNSEIDQPDDIELLKVICAEFSNLLGIRLGQRELPMLRAKLKKRALFLGISDLTEYLAYYQSHSNSELKPLVSLLTTHHTSFFREFQQFEFLTHKLLRELIARVRSRNDRTLRIWSAGCSKGHEVYSLGMYLDFYLSKMAPEIDFQILGTDVDEKSITIAKNGVYHRREIKEIPLNFMSNHWVYGTEAISDFAKVGQKLRSRCSFETMNLLSIPKGFAKERFDLIFCRNVFIYFNLQNIKTVASELLNLLNPSGFLLIGIAESIHGFGLNVTSCGPSIYQLTSHQTVSEMISAGQYPSSKKIQKPNLDHPSPALSQESTDLIRVLCVDDSPVIQRLMKQILRKEFGFEIIATAMNGIEARSQLRTHQPDILTLDIQMPEENGIEYLKKSFNSNHPPVVIVSTVSREDAISTLKALELGASDYVEKPTLDSLAERGEEIRMKLRCVLENRRKSE